MFFNFFELVKKDEIRIRNQVNQTFILQKSSVLPNFFWRGPGIKILDLDNLNWVFKKACFLDLPLISSF